MEVLIVAKTRMSDAYCCVGGLELPTSRSVRLLQANGQNMPNDVSFEVGEVWELRYIPHPNPKPPHIEDVLVTRYHYLRRQSNLSSFLRQRIRPWRGNPGVIFDGKLCATGSGSGYICASAGIPAQSTGYWIADRDLVRDEAFGRERYIYPSEYGVRNFPYVGMAQSITRIPKGTLIRVSLARWWHPEDSPDMEDRCYVQLSGWYLS